LDKNRPVCPQICELLCVDIVNGVYDADRRLPAVRELAAGWSVNPNTVQHAFDQLGQDGVLYAVQNVGWFVSEDNAVAVQTLEALAQEKTAAFFADMENLGLNVEAVKARVKEWNV
jgi:DNA-binding transcriptional regulator YhcF (GntR family)